MCLAVLSACVAVHHLCAWCLWRPEGGDRPPWNGSYRGLRGLLWVMGPLLSPALAPFYSGKYRYAMLTREEPFLGMNYIHNVSKHGLYLFPEFVCDLK